MPIGSVDSWFYSFRAIDDILVIHVDLTPNKEREAHAFAWLDNEEQDRWNRYRYDRPQREFALCRAALRAVLCNRIGCDNTQLVVGVSSHGKPFALVNGIASPANFNVSHSGNHGLIAFALKRRLGVDVEERVLRHDIDGVARTVFGPNEQADLASASGCQKTRLFFRLWTLKEALIKAIGLGFSMNVAQFEIPPDMRLGARRCIFRFPQMPDIRWKLENLSNSNISAAIAYEMD